MKFARQKSWRHFEVKLRSVAMLWVVGVSIIAGFTRANYLREFESLKRDFVHTQMEHSRNVANSFAFKIQSLQQGLRTIARLPSIWEIDRTGENLSSDARLTIQEIINNLNTMIQLSEIYIVPAGFDPDRIDPRTGKHSVPITTFDEIIVGRSPAKKAGKKPHQKWRSSNTERWRPS